MVFDLFTEDPMSFTKVAAIALVSAAMNGVAVAGPEEDTVLATFESLCLEQINDLGAIAATASRMGLVAVPDDKKVEFGKPTWSSLDQLK
jgi:hypothetical protein